MGGLLVNVCDLIDEFMNGRGEGQILGGQIRGSHPPVLKE